MEDKKQTGYPVYTEDVLGGLNSVASSGDFTGLEPTPPQTSNEAASYAALYSVPNQTSTSNKSATRSKSKKLKF